MDQLDELEAREGKLRDESQRGQEAKAVLESWVFKEAFQALRDRCWETFRAIPEEDTTGMAKIRYTLSVIDSVEKDVTHHMNTGKLADADLGMLATLREQIKRFAA